MLFRSIRAYGYKENLTSKKKSIRNYVSMYNPEYEDETFSIKRLDFLNDVNVYKLLCCYLYKCADTYFAKLKNDANLTNMRKRLLKTYRTLTGGTTVDMMQEVETFLKEHEIVCQKCLQPDMS